MKWLKVLFLLLIIAGVFAVAFVYLGTFEPAADVPHSDITYRLLETTRDRAIALRAKAIAVPLLDDPKLLTEGAEHYHAMCTGCHLAPGMADSEIRPGLYPPPPNLSEHQHHTPGETFWIIKHGIKMSAMPAWGKTHDDQAIWGLVAFLQKLPEMTPEQYHALVNRAGENRHGHTHTHGDHSHSDSAGEEHLHGNTIESHAQSSEHDSSSETHHHGHSDTSASESERGKEHPGHGTQESVDLAVTSVVDAFQQALAKGDTTAAEALLNPAVKIFESGHSERSRGEYAAHHLAADATFLKQAKITLLSRTGDMVGDLAWVGSETRITTSENGKPADLLNTDSISNL